MTKLSIIIPVYNTKAFLSECLDSVLKTINNETEVIVVDDGSTDGSGEICDKYAKNNSRLIVLHEKNKGVSAARNLGVKHAKGEYLMFVDSDDALEDGWTSVIKRIDGKDLYIIDDRLDNKDSHEIKKYIIGRNKENIILSAPTSKIYRREFLKEKKITFEEKIIHGEDMLYLLEILSKTNECEIINKKIYNYRVYTGSSSRSFREEMLKSDRLFHDRIAKTNVDEEDKLFLRQNAVFNLLQKISYQKTFNDAKPLFSKLNNNFYKDALKNKYIIKWKYRPILSLFKLRCYRLIYNIFRIINN